MSKKILAGKNHFASENKIKVINIKISENQKKKP
jgi:hypothetical protein